jgi:uncharacterized YigZ family protein
LFIVEDIFSTNFEIKKSNFIAYLVPISQFKELHVKLKSEHPKARHIVWATRYFNEFEQIVENSSDDGEPKGTSGPPILNVMRGAELIQSAILVVRYFGGIKLGTGGLVRAYGSSAKEVIESALLLNYVKKDLLKFHIGFSLISRFEHFLQTHEFEEAKKDFDANGAMFSINVSEEQRAKFLDFAQPFVMEEFRVL